MANIHGLGSFESSGNRNQFDGERGNVPNFLNSWVAPAEARKNPRDESIFDMLKLAFCPGLTLRSFIFMISMLDIAVFILCFLCSLFTNTGLDSRQFLGMNKVILHIFDKDFVKMRDSF